MYKYGVFPGPIFSLFGLNRTIYSVNFPTQSKNKKIWTRKTLDLNTFLQTLKKGNLQTKYSKCNKMLTNSGDCSVCIWSVNFPVAKWYVTTWWWQLYSVFHILKIFSMIFSLFCLQLLLKQVIDLFVVDTKHFVCNHLRTLNLFNLNFYKFSPSDFTASQSCKCFDVFSHHTYLKLEHVNY